MGFAYPLVKSFSDEYLIKKDPRGAVTTMERTAIFKILSPDGSPRLKGIPPIAAWTVAFGR